MDARNLKVDGQRLWATVMETAAIGGTRKGGICRLALSDDDRAIRDWFRASAEAAGCSVSIDTMGNMFARRAGRNAAQPAIAIGSHLDTQPTGGKFDGVIGVLAGLEVLRILHESNYETHAPIEVVNWTNEEGSRFAPAMLASGVFAGALSLDYAYSRTDRAGQSFGDELLRIGYRGETPCGGRSLAAHFELHIEQGPILEAEQRRIGIVTGVQGMRWYEVTVTGAESHAGSTPMHLRRDALLVAARLIDGIETIATSRSDAVATVGLVECTPNSRNVVPGSVFFSVDLRHPQDEMVAAMEAGLLALIERARAGTCAIVCERVWDSPAVHFDAGCIGAVRRATESLGVTSREMVSGAGHDSAYIARVAPTTMIFIPCAGGLSHNEAESIEQPDLTLGAEVLLRAVLDTDQRLAERDPSTNRPAH
jgi:N-carbamoyl-L-amino-acid hydrolase